MDANFIDDSLRFLKWLETDCELRATVQVQVQTLRLKASFLKAILSCSGKWHTEDGCLDALLTCLSAPLNIRVQTLGLQESFLAAILGCTGKWHSEDENLRALLTHIQAVVLSVDEGLQPLWSNWIQIASREDWTVPMDLDAQISRVLEGTEHVKANVEKVYTLLSRSSRSTSYMTGEAMIEVLNFLVENMGDLLTCKADSIIPFKKEIEAVERGLRSLRNFLGFSSKRCSNIEKQQDLLTHVEGVADNIACLLYLCSFNIKMEDQRVNKMKHELFGQLKRIQPVHPEVRNIYIEVLKASRLPEQSTSMLDVFILDFLDSLLDNILELSETDIGFIISVKDQMLALHKELRSLKYYVIDPLWKEHTKHDDNFNVLFEHTNFLVSETGSVIYSFYGDEKSEDMVRELNSSVSDLSAKLELVKKEARKIYDKLVSKSLRCNFPKTDELGFTSFILQNLNELLICKADLFAQLNHPIEAVEKELTSLREDFSRIAQQSSKHEGFKDCRAHFHDITCQTEYVIDSFVTGDGPVWRHMLGLFDIIEEIKVIRTELEHTKNNTIDVNSVHKISGFPTQVSIETDSPKNDELLRFNDRAEDETRKSTTEIVVFEDKAEKLREQLTIGSGKLQIISIVGMPGIGKTTLADSVFEHPLVNFCFHVRARCCITQVFQERRLLLEILGQVTGETEWWKKFDDQDLAAELCKSLRGKRYLIYMDDMWDVRPWEQMKASFPDDGNGSRIIFTSRFHDIASQVQSDSLNYPLSPLSDDKSWKMLQVKLFQKESCPEELVKIGQEIARNCKGLPLTIDVIAGVLRMTETKEECWQRVAESLGALIADDPQGQCKKALELSYHHLPDHLKPCFIYFGAYPEDAQVSAKRLIGLWIAEGLIQVQMADQRSLEEAAESYLNDLVRRSLVTISKRSSLGGIKTSQVHDLLHDFALAKAKEERFLLTMEADESLYTLSSDGHTLHEEYRFCLYPHKLMQFAMSKSSGPRSLLFVVKTSRPYCECRYLSFICDKFRLLRVLDLQGINNGYCPSIFSLVPLRFLAIRGNKEEILSRIHNLQNLETFLLGEEILSRMHNLQNLETFRLGEAGDRAPLAENIWNLVRLRHFHAGSFRIALHRVHEDNEKSVQLNNLRTLSTPFLRYGEDAENIMKRLPNLQKLKCKFLDSWDSSENCNVFPSLDFLKQLESLKVIYSGEVLYPCKLKFPLYLKKLTLSEFRLPWSEISIIGKLENLEVLKLQNSAFHGRKWDMRDEEFCKLKFLSLYVLNLQEWNASGDHLPCLERLEVHCCEKLKELPSCLADVPTLQKISLWWCCTSAEISAEKIKEEQEEKGNEQFEVSMDPPSRKEFLAARLLNSIGDDRIQKSTRRRSKMLPTLLALMG